MLPRSGFVILDTAVTSELAAEGLARDLVRAIQQARRGAGLEVSDRIVLTVSGDEQLREAVRVHQQLIKSETLALALEVVDAMSGATEVTVGDNIKAALSLDKAEAQSTR